MIKKAVLFMGFALILGTCAPVSQTTVTPTAPLAPVQTPLPPLPEATPEMPGMDSCGGM